MFRIISKCQMHEFVGMVGLAFCGGALGAAFGALPSLILFGLLVIIGSVLQIATGEDFFLQTIAFGDIFGPHIAFAGGIAASAYAAKKKYLKTTGKDIITPLLFEKNPEPLLVGGLFGIIGLCIRALFENSIPLTFDAIAAAIFLLGITARLMFSSKGILRKHPVDLEINKDDKKNGVWLPWESDILSLIFLGAIMGLIAAKITVVSGNEYLVFGIACVSLLFLQFGNHVPITHHIVLPASLAMTISDNLFVGVFFGIIGALLGEFGARLFYNQGDTHIDPPAFSLMITSLLIFGTGAIIM